MYMFNIVDEKTFTLARNNRYGNPAMTFINKIHSNLLSKCNYYIFNRQKNILVKLILNIIACQGLLLTVQGLMCEPLSQMSTKELARIIFNPRNSHQNWGRELRSHREYKYAARLAWLSDHKVKPK